MTLGSTRPLTEVSIRNISWGVKAASTNALKGNLVNIETEARKRGLRINENKTKYEYMEVTRAASNSDHLRCGQY